MKGLLTGVRARFQDFNIKKKLMVVMMLTSAVMLFLSMAGTTVEDFRQAQAGIEEQAGTLGEMLAFNSTSALDFLDESAAEETLAALQVEKSITAAAVYNAEGELFATYPPGAKDGAVPKTVDRLSGNYWQTAFMENFTPIDNESGFLGTVYLKFDLSFLYSELTDRVFVGALIFGGLCLLTLYVVSLAQRLISRPILNLVGVADLVSDKHDYSVRAEKVGNDEIGRLTDSFNNMLQTISVNQEELKSYQEHLEEQVEQRTQELRDSEERTRVILETAPDGIMTVDSHGKILAYNAAAEEMFGCVLHASEQPRFLNLVDAADKERAKAVFSHSPDLKENGIELALRRDGESTFPASLSFSEVAQGAEVQYTLIIRDITSFHEAQAALQRGLEQAQAASQAKSDFLANMSHEIRTPLNGIIGMTNFALDTNLNAKQQDFLDTVKESADNLLAILNDILDFSKIEADRLDIEFVNFNLRDLVESMVRTLQSKFIDSHVELLCRFESGLPDSLVGDPARIRQVLINLVGNAQKFTPRGEVVLSITTTPAPEPLLCFEVRDTGIGIPKEKQSLIFDAFSQADTSTSRHYGGTGLGLAISAKLASLMQGSLSVESAEQEGSTFTLTIPLKVQEGVGTTVLPVALEHLRGLKVLGVDDNRINREILTQLLGEQMGVEIECAEGGPEALELLKQRKQDGDLYDLIISDHQMPGMDGLEFLRLANELLAPESIPVLVLSSLDRINAQERGHDLNVSSWLLKPILPTTLTHSLCEALGETVPIPEGEQPLEIKVEPLIEDRRRYTPRLNILVAEDHQINQKIIKRLLEKYGHDVIIADNGQEAIEVLTNLGQFDPARSNSSESIDLVLMDVQMPIMGGVEATHIIRSKEQELNKHLPVIALTAHALKGHREEYLNSGLDDYLTKPIDTEKLLVVLQKYTPTDKMMKLAQEIPNFELDESERATAGLLSSGMLRDTDTLLRAVGGNYDLLMEIVVELYASLAASPPE